MRVSRWAGRGALGVVGLAALDVGTATLVDRPSRKPIRVDRDAPEVVTFLAAERALMASLDLAVSEHT